MNENKLSSVLIILVPQVLELITGKYGISEEAAAEAFYCSELYERLSEEETKLWRLSARALFDMYEEERETGKITYPEEV